MPSRTYAQIECSLTSSKRLRGLSDHKTRWAYICAHLSDYCTYTGLFRYPLHVWAYDTQISQNDLGEAIRELTMAGLIEYDEGESYVRIIGWFHKRSGPDNPNRVDSVISDLSRLDDVHPQMLCRAVSELASSAVRRSLRWKQQGAGREQLYRSLKQLLGETYQDHGDAFLECLRDELVGLPGAVATEIHAIFPPLIISSMTLDEKPSGRVPPTLLEHETRRDVDETEMKTKKDLEETAQIPRFAVSEVQRLDEPLDTLRKREGPTVATINSSLAKQAMQA